MSAVALSTQAYNLHMCIHYNILVRQFLIQARAIGYYINQSSITVIKIVTVGTLS